MPSVFIHRASTFAIASNTPTKLPWNGTLGDEWNMHAGEGETIVFPYPGVWLATVQVTFAQANNVSGWRAVALLGEAMPSPVVLALNRKTPLAERPTTVRLTHGMRVNQGDAVSVQAEQMSTGPLNVLGDPSQPPGAGTYFQALMLSS